MGKRLLLLILLLLWPWLADAQVAQIQQLGTRFDAGGLVALGTNFNTINQQSVATTVVPGNGQYIYVTGLYMGACESNTTGTAVTNGNFTTTNLNGAEFAISIPATLGACAGAGTPAPAAFSFPTPLKAATPGVAVVLTSPTAGAQVGFATEIFYYVAP